MGLRVGPGLCEASETLMGISTWYAAGVMGSGRGRGLPPVPRNGPLTREEKWAIAGLAFCAFVAIAGVAIIVWAMLTAPPQDNSWCARWVSGHCAERVNER